MIVYSDGGVETEVSQRRIGIYPAAAPWHSTLLPNKISNESIYWMFLEHTTCVDNIFNNNLFRLL